MLSVQPKALSMAWAVPSAPVSKKEQQVIHSEIKRLAIGAAIGAGLAAIYLHAPHAHAEPLNDPAHQHDMAVMCTELAEDPTFGGVNKLIVAWQKQEGTSTVAAQMGTQTLFDAVTFDCPQYQPLIKAWANTLPPVNSPPANTVGVIA